MKKLFLFLIFIVFALLANSTTIYNIGESLTGYEYNEDWDRWFPRKLSIWAGKNNLERTVVFLHFGSRSGDLVVDLGSSSDKRNQLRKTIEKILGWSVTAQRSRINATRTIGCFGKKTSTICKQTGIANQRGELGLRFFSTKKGKEVSIVFNIIDKDDPLHKANIYFNPSAMEKLYNLLENIE